MDFAEERTEMVGGGGGEGFGGGGGEEPEADEAVEREIGDEVFGGKNLQGGGTRVVAWVEPALNAGAIVCDAGAEAYGRAHDVHGDWTPKETRNGHV